MLWGRRSFLAGVACLMLAPSARADGGHLVEMLAQLPEDPVTYRSLPLFTYADLRAAEAAAGVTTPASEEAFMALSEAERAAWRENLSRLKVLPETIRTYAAGLGSHTVTSYNATGPDWFAIDRVMGAFDLPPHRVTIAGGDDDMNDPLGFDYALPQRGFVRDEIDGVGVWSRFADDAQASALVDSASAGDIFDDGLMSSLRLAVLPDLLIAAKAWPDLRALLAVEAGRAPHAAAADLLAPMVEALAAVEGGEGPLVQAMAVSVMDAGFSADGLALVADAIASGGMVDPSALEGAVAATPAGPPLPLYPLALFADVAAGEEQLTVIAVPYTDRKTAEAGAAVIASRLETWQPGGSGEALLSRIGGRVSTAVVDDGRVAPALVATFRSVIVAAAAGEAPDAVAEKAPPVAAPPVPAGGAVALVAVRYPLDGAESNAAPGALLAVIQQAIFNRDFALLATP